MRLPTSCEQRLRSCPQTGAGVHAWLAGTALSLANHGVPTDEAARLLRDHSTHCGRVIREREIQAAVTSAYQLRNEAGPSSSPRAPARRPRWPNSHPGILEKIQKEGFGLADLWEASPLRVEYTEPDAILQELFRPDELVCCAASATTSETRALRDWLGHLAGLQFMVPSPMRAVWGKTKDGKDSMRCNDNVAPRRFLVVECDRGSFDLHAGILRWLKQYLPLALAVHSGGKSLHGWFNVQHTCEERALKFMRLAKALGADEHSWVPCQLMRMPNGRRDNGKPQPVMYFNPKAL